MGNLKTTIQELRNKFDHGDIAKIATELEGNVERADVYNILRGKCLNDVRRTKMVLDATREFLQNKQAQYGIDDQG